MTNLLPKNEFIRIFHSPAGQETYKLYRELESSTVEELKRIYEGCEFAERIAPVIKDMIEEREAQKSTKEVNA